MKKLAVVTSGLVLLGVSTAWRQTGAAGEAAVVKVRSAYVAAVKAGDAAGIAKLYAPDGIEMPPNQPMQKGRAAVLAFHKAFTESMASPAQLTVTPIETKVSGDIAFDVGTYTQKVTPKGGQAAEDKGKYVVLLKRSGGEWWVSHAIYNSDLPPPGTK